MVGTEGSVLTISGVAQEAVGTNLGQGTRLIFLIWTETLKWL